MENIIFCAVETPLYQTFQFPLTFIQNNFFIQNWNHTLLLILFSIFYYKQLTEFILNQLINSLLVCRSVKSRFENDTALEKVKKQKS